MNIDAIWQMKINFAGQAGRGNNEEFGLLSLEYDENFCMGGPGVILSRETLRLGKKIWFSFAFLQNKCNKLIEFGLQLHHTFQRV